MKTTFRKTIDTFDESLLADDTTVIEPIALDLDKITADVFDHIHTAEPPKRKRKKWFPILIAAVISTAVIGTTVIAVKSGLDSRFADVVSGETDAVDLYDDGSFTFDTTDDNLQANFLGVTGDSTTVFAGMELSYKDGRTFTGTYDGFLDPEPAEAFFEPEEHLYKAKQTGTVAILDVNGGEIPDSFEKISHEDLECGLKAVQQNGSDLLGINQMTYLLSKDKKTLKIYFSLDTSEPNCAVDGTLTFGANYITLYRLTEKLAAYDVFDAETLQTAADLCQSKGITDSTRWERENGQYVLYRFTTQKQALPFTTSFKMHYDAQNNYLNLTLNKDNAPHTVKDDQVLSLSLEPFSAKLTGDDIVLGEHSEKSPHEWQKEWAAHEDFLTMAEENTKIVLQDGTVYYFGFHVNNLNVTAEADGTTKAFVHVEGDAFYTEQPISYYQQLQNTSLETTQFSGTWYMKRVLVDPRNIAQVIVNGDIVYSADNT